MEDNQDIKPQILVEQSENDGPSEPQKPAKQIAQDIDQSIVEFGKDIDNTSSRQTWLVLAAFGVLICGIVYYFFFSTPKPTNPDDFPIQNKPLKGSALPAPTLIRGQPASDEGAVTPKAPDPEPVKAAAPLMPSPRPPLPVPSAPLISPSPPALKEESNQAAHAQAKQSKITSNMILSNGGGSESPKLPVRDLSNNFHVQPTSAKSVQVTAIGNMSLLISQGKMLEAVLETPLNTSFPGPIRAIMSRDVFSEQGENVLIPKGSRVIGTLQSQYVPGQDRILIQWNRIILPNGLDIMVQDAQATDSLGQLGVRGNAHTQFINTIGNAILLSVINVGTVKAMQSLFKVRTNQTGIGGGYALNPDGTYQTNAQGNPIAIPPRAVVPDPAEEAASQAATDLSNTTKQWMQNNIISKPFISINQGTIVKIFVNQDIVFPNQIGSGMNLIK